MPYVPELQLTGIWRSHFDLGNWPGFFQVAVAHTGERWNDLDTLNVPARQEMDAYTLMHLSAGIENDSSTGPSAWGVVAGRQTKAIASRPGAR